ncbi:Arc family DNA-binding protein [Mesorhizobium sp. ANAO-SY3R2]|uniref:Arc family DNA-binding protein n=1 Tax=Mesorhizobium sp. ANAO-SY3R2 TaxID=3166644 RepID=UPI00366DD383
MAKPGRGSDQFPLRLPPGMRDQIKRAAEESGKSMNSEILDVLREAFPEDPSLEELVDALDYSIAMLRELRAQSPSGKVTGGNKFLTVLGRVEATNSELWKSAGEDRPSPVIMLSRDVLGGMRALQEQLELPKGILDSLASDLIQMSLDRIASGEENLKVWIGEGEGRRMIEIKPLSPEGSDDK